MDVECYSLQPVIVDLFSSLDEQPMCIQVAVIDALEDFVLQWLCRHNLPCNMSKQWKFELDHTSPLRTISDWLRQIATVFVTSRFIHDIYVHVTRSVTDTCNVKTEDESKGTTSCDGDRLTDVFPVTETDTECSVNCYTQHLPDDTPPTSASLPPYLNDRVADNDTAPAPTSAETVSSCESQRTRTCQQLLSRLQPVDSGRWSNDGSAAVVSSSAGNDVSLRDQSFPSAAATTKSTLRKVTCSSVGQRRRRQRSADKRLVNGQTVCEICGAVVKCLKSHLLKHSEPRHKCHYCSFATRQLQSLRIHERRIHTNDRPHLCEACGKSFVKSTLLKEHINEKHGMVKRERRYKCSSCAYAAYTASMLQRHEVRHTPCRQPQHRCDTCGARLMTIYSLNEHKRLSHVDERPFPCAICGFTAKSVKRLRSHTRCHEEKTFACDLCSKKFTMRAQLVRHQLVHSGLKPFNCPYCTYRSAIIENLRKHCKTVHKLLYPPKKRDVARTNDFTLSQTIPERHTVMDTVPDRHMVTNSAELPVCATSTPGNDVCKRCDDVTVTP